MDEADHDILGRMAVDRLAAATLAARDAAFFEWDLRTETALATSTHLTMFGYEPGAWEVTYDEWAKRVHPDDVGPADRKMQALIAGERPVYDAEYRFRDASGTYRWVIARAYVTAHDSDGSPSRVTGWFVLSGRKATSAAGLITGTEVLGQLASGVAHDFNNLLAIVVSNVALLQATASAEQQPLLEEVHLALQRGQQLTSALLSHARRRAPQITVVEVGQRLRAIERLLRTALGRRHLLELHLPESGHAIDVDEVAFDQAVLNLIANARDALPPDGSGVVRVRLEALEVTDDAASRHGVLPGSYVRLAVADDGAGMSAAVLRRAAEPLFTTKPEGSGTGLGLSSCQRLVEAAGGFLELHSSLGAGTEVALHWPRKSAPPADEQAPVRSPRRRLLLVDDEAALVRGLQRQLEGIGYAVQAVSNPRAALAALEGSPVDLMVTDLVMPFTLDGLGLATRARALSPSLPVIFITGYADPDTEARARRLGPVVRKPFTLEALDAQVQALLRAEPPR